MHARITRLYSSLREATKGPIAVSLIVAFAIVLMGIFFSGGDTTRGPVKTTSMTTVGTSTLGNGDKEFDELLKHIPQLLATSSASSSLSEEQKKYLEDYLKSEGDRIGSAMIKSMASSIDRRKFDPHFTIKDLNVVSDDSEPSLRKYAHDAGVITNKYAALTVEKPESIMARSLKNKDRSALLALGTAATDYKNLASDLRALSVPQSLAQEHLAVINGYDIMSRSLFELVRLIDDPLTGAAAWEVYIKENYYMTKGFVGIIVSLHKQGVLFTDKSDPSYNFRWRE